MAPRLVKWLGGKLTLVVGAALTGTGLLLYYFEPAPVQQLSLAAYDALVRATQRPTQGGHVTVVDIDEASLTRFGQWPWPRYRLAQLTSTLFENGASVVAFDVVFKEPDRTSPDVYLADLRRSLAPTAGLNGLPASAHNFERLFAGAMAGRPVVLGAFLRPQPLPAEPELDGQTFTTLNCMLRPGRPHDNVSTRLPRAWAADLPLTLLQQAAAGVGFINADVDNDNVVRRCDLLWTYGDKEFCPSLGLEALRLHLKASFVEVQHNPTGISGLRVRGTHIPTDKQGRVLLNFRSLNEIGRSTPYISAASVLDGSAAPEQVDGRIVFVGSSAMGLRDLKATPLTGQFAGVETHAVLIDNILSGDVLRKPAGMELLEIVGIALAGCLLTLVIHQRRAWWAMVITGLVLASVVSVSYLLMDRWQLVFVPARLIFSVILVYLVLTSIRYWQEEFRRKQLRAMFSPMVSRQVLEYMEKHPESFSLSGRDTETSVLFSDLAGFTPIAERLSASSVTELLNTYFSAMNRCIHARNGYVDKFQGDAIMAVWGAPFPLADHAIQACLSALEQHQRAKALQSAFREQYGIDLSVRIGINSGLVKAGNMGSADRNQYTVIGDAVNLAARLEPINKRYDTAILIGEETYRQACDAIEARLVDRIVVKGKTESILIYELLAPAGGLNPVQMQTVHWYEEALRRCWDQAWEAAYDAILSALQCSPADGPSLLLRDRITEFRIRPPAREWDGAFVLAGK